MGVEKGGLDALFLHALESVGAISQYCTIKAGVCKISNSAVKQIIKTTNGLALLVDAFPEKNKKTDGRTWLLPKGL